MSDTMPDGTEWPRTAAMSVAGRILTIMGCVNEKGWPFKDDQGIVSNMIADYAKLCRDAAVAQTRAEFEAALAAKDAEIARWKRAIEGLTPSGSEFVNDPERCADYIRERTRYPRMIIELRADLTAAREREGRLREALQSLVSHDDLTRSKGGREPRWCPCCDSTEKGDGSVSHYLSCHFEQARMLLTTPASEPAEDNDWGRSKSQDKRFRAQGKPEPPTDAGKREGEA